MEESSEKVNSWAWPHIPLMVLAFLSMTYSHSAWSGDFEWSNVEWMPGIIYACGTMAILFAHEMGHYLTARNAGVNASKPYFIPGIPLGLPGLVMPFIGTFGAFIKMELKPMSRSVLMRIAANGPVAGFVLAVPALMIGFAMSEIEPVPETATFLGDSLLLMLGEAIFFPVIPEGHDVFLHPLAMAGWVGCLLTAINLLPIGQLDGGHIAYAEFGSAWNRMTPLVGLAVVVMGVFFFAGWLMLGVLIWVFGLRHPDITTKSELTTHDHVLAIAAVVMFVLCFSPAPIEGHSLYAILNDFFMNEWINS